MTEETKKSCAKCAYGLTPIEHPPCSSCSNSSEWLDITSTNDCFISYEANHYDNHYVSDHQPIETMQANMTPEEFIGFLKGNILKYVCRLGKKDAGEKEAAKILRYAEWLHQATQGKTINPREN